MAALTHLPQCGAVIERDEVDRITQLMQWLSAEIRSRQQQFARENVAGFVEHVSAGGSLPRILLLLDGWETLSEISEESTLGRMTDELLQILRDGSAVGMYAAATGGRALGTGRMASSFSQVSSSDPFSTTMTSKSEQDSPSMTSVS